MTLISTFKRKRLFLKKFCHPTRFHVFVVVAVGLYLLMTRFHKEERKTTITVKDTNYTYKNLIKDLKNSIIQNEGRVCDLPKTEPYAVKLEEEVNQVPCEDTDWVQCFLDECYVVEAIRKSTEDLFCVYQDMSYVNEYWYAVGQPVKIVGNRSYKLKKSDHVKVFCNGFRMRDLRRPLPIPTSLNLSLSLLEENQWVGYKAGFRRLPPLEPPNLGPRLNILILIFNCMSKNAFIRQMEESYMELKQMGAVFLDGYNTVGDGSSATLFPIFSGKSELEFAEDEIGSKYSTYSSFIFKHLSNSGYRTAFFKDSIGDFQRHFKGFNDMVDHYLYPLLLEAYKSQSVKNNLNFCMGSQPLHELMFDLTYQFFQQSGNHFAFTFMGHTCNDQFTMNSAVDPYLAFFLRRIQQGGRLKETVVFIMGDHGPKYAPALKYPQSRLEERLPLMAIIPPYELKRTRPQAWEALKANLDVLTTPFDIHSTLVDILGLGELRNKEKIPMASLPRGMTLLQPIPKTRSCGEAGILPHWCSCMFEAPVDRSEPVYLEVGVAVATYINKVTMDYRDICAMLKLTSVVTVERQSNHEHVSKVRARGEFYQAVITMSPGRALFEATVTYFEKENHFEINPRHVTRINTPGNSSACIRKVHPHLYDYCYCINQTLIN